MNDLRLASRKGAICPENFLVGNEQIRKTKATRQIERALARQRRILARLQKLAERQRQKKESRELWQHVKTLMAAKRKPTMRVRSKNEYGSIYFPRTIQYNRNSLYQTTSTSRGTQYTGLKGIVKSIQDYSPVAFLNPPRNPCTIKSYRRNALSAEIRCEPRMWQYPIVTQPMAPWALDGLTGSPIDTSISAALGFDINLANKALLKAYAKVNEANIQMGEYLFEWKQVLKLLKDPLRTLMSFHKTLERWTRRDAWIYVPQRALKRSPENVIGVPPVGGILMSMRTRRTLSLKGVSKQMIQAASNRWLQYRYGIAPLALDITTILSWYQGNLEKPWSRSASARHNVSRKKTVSDYVSNTQQFSRIFKVSKIEGEHYSAKVWYTVKYDPPALYKQGIHPSQWLNVLWNALPYSFVADWVVSLDDWLTASRTLPWIEYGPNTVTRKVWQKTTARCHRVLPLYTIFGPYELAVTGDPVAISVKEQMRREVNLPRVMEVMLIDRWSSVKNLLTGLALIINPILNRR